MLTVIARGAVIATLAVAGLLLFPSDSAIAHSGGSNPDHLSLVISPPKTGTTTSTPFSSSHADSCGNTHTITYCHHHALANADWSFDEGASAGQGVEFNIQPGGGYLYAVGYVSSVTPNCSDSNPRGYNVLIQVWVWDYSRSVWRQLGLTNMAHVTPWVSQGQWVQVHQTIGTVDQHDWFTDCWEGVHVHEDYYNYEHFAAWTDKAWIGSSLNVDYNYWWLNTALGVFGGTYGQGPDSHGGTWTGY